MKKIVVATIALWLSLTSLFAQSADGVNGSWLNETKDVKVTIYKAGDKYIGKIAWLQNMYEADGKTPKKDTKNNNASLRDRTIINLDILTGFIYDDGEWTGGELYDPKSGKTYKSKMKISNGKLEIRGYVGSPMCGKTTTWTKTS